MAERENERLFKLFRDHEDLVGESQTTLISLRAIIIAIRELECGRLDMRRQLADFLKAIRDSEPRIVPLINLTTEIEDEAERLALFDKDSIEDIKSGLIALFEKGISAYTSTMRKVVFHGSRLIEHDDFIVVHSASSMVINSLIEAWKADKEFNVLVLKQDLMKTRIVVDALEEAGIPLTVIPEHSFIHFVDTTTKVLLGAGSITSDREFVAAVGTTSIVSVTHLHKIPVYLLTDSYKFSHRPSNEHQIHKRWQSEVHDARVYRYLKFSHDKVELEYVDHLITEEGELNKTEFKRQQLGAGRNRD